MLWVVQASRILPCHAGSGQAPQHPGLAVGVLSRPARPLPRKTLTTPHAIPYAAVVMQTTSPVAPPVVQCRASCRPMAVTLRPLGRSGQGPCTVRLGSASGLSVERLAAGRLSVQPTIPGTACPAPSKACAAASLPEAFHSGSGLSGRRLVCGCGEALSCETSSGDGWVQAGLWSSGQPMSPERERRPLRGCSRPRLRTRSGSRP